MFADAEVIEADLIGQGDLVEKVAQALDGTGGDAGHRVCVGCYKTVDADLHPLLVVRMGAAATTRWNPACGDLARSRDFVRWSVNSISAVAADCGDS